MEIDNDLEEKHSLDKVRFSIRNCKTETMSSDETSYIFIFITVFIRVGLKFSKTFVKIRQLPIMCGFFFFIFTTKQKSHKKEMHMTYLL
jgi:hypothetical protein